MPPRTVEIPAAGVVVLRGASEVVLVHRPKYDDWSFPKGKSERGELMPVTAAREVREETGLRVALGAPLSRQRYRVADGRKTVHYWTGQVAAGTTDDVAGHSQPGEIDAVEWVPLDEAPARLTYPRDRETLSEALALAGPTTPLVVVRHTSAVGRGSWQREDRLRPLDDTGRRQAVTLAGLLHAYDVQRVVTSSSIRCVQSVAPYAGLARLIPERLPTLTEEDASPRSVRALAADLLADLGRPTVVCSHRPVLPWLFDGLGVNDPRLEKGEMAVLHVRDGAVRAVETHQA